MFNLFNKLFNRKAETPPNTEKEPEQVQAASAPETAPAVTNENVQAALSVETEVAQENTADEVPQAEAESTETAEENVQAALNAETEVAQENTVEAEPMRHSWATPVVEEVKETVQSAEQWAEDMAHAVAEKADELEMRAEILAEETSESVSHWAQGMAHAVEEKLDELEMRAEILVDEAKEAVVESVQTLEHALEGENALPEPELLPEEPVAPEAEESLGWTARLARGLSKSRNQMAKSLAGVFGGGKIDEDLYEELETVLITSDMGIEATEQLMNEVRNRVSLKGLKDGAELRSALKDAIYDLLKPLEQPLVLPDNGQPFVIMMAGINGAGKTTSIGKLAKYFQSQGKSVMLAAGDTFRAAAREQLQEWGARNNITVISQEKGDSAAVCFDAVEAAKARKIDVVLADTAGRLPTQLHLMEEIKKVKRVLQKSMPDAPHEIMVVLDANIGQNAVNQVVAFDDALGVTGLIVTKLDGTAKGGVLAALASSRAIPVRYIGVGESIDDLRPFNAKAFVDALLDEWSA
ncbi:signal recognition particle-docking protein FtsY [Kingella kingae]|uniref:signal recognition particle-docking protein FtsY n=1 Tax=Kingella kingae TaxID=504 RepID=UPI0002F23285|nr:signal recognition particle-docking protein FtsY [Kingella kingae]MDK4556229.1 signal recognition particle-docking protein FtsY [Kingella kingae]MDK4585322.1 signal recognition particle-docking protein FtsY [Kingella kingae]MDK4589286.1 signal recognition particle-docking protein FtsY [Kingella kingae]MDK4597540.1 signal recognition particle-docking protein FtsY [Kingella kingae]MDK4601482.1 signal recognition particle-docking protein FtsY [Kingella kingae]